MSGRRKVDIVGDKVADRVPFLEDALDRADGPGPGDLSGQVQVVLSQRRPASLQELKAASVDVPTSRHGRVGATPAVVESGAALSQAVRVWRGYYPVGLFLAPALVQRPAVVVGPAMIEAPGITHDKDNVQDLASGIRGLISDAEHILGVAWLRAVCLMPEKSWQDKATLSHASLPVEPWTPSL